MVKLFFSFIFNIKFQNLFEEAENKRTKLYLSNHLSFYDIVFLSFFLPSHTKIFLDTSRYPNWIKKYLKKFHRLHIDLNYKAPTQHILNQINYGESVLLFPEGKTSFNGNISQIEHEFAQIAYESNALLIPIHIDTIRLRKVKTLFQCIKKFGTPIKILIGQSFELHNDDHQHQNNFQKHHFLANQIFQKLCDVQCQALIPNHTLFEELISASKLYGAKKLISEDIEFSPISYNRILLGSFILGKKLKKIVGDEDHIGLFLPNSNGFIISFFSFQAYGLIPVLLNYSLGGHGVLNMIKISNLKYLITSKRFIRKGNLQHIIDYIQDHIKIIYLEDIRKSFNLTDKVKASIASKIPKFYYNKITKTNNTQPAIIFYTSGTEGFPKAVLLSHYNILSNVYQFTTYIDINHSENDMLFNALPIFHCFGLTVGVLSPLFKGINLFIYPSPLHYKEIPILCNRKHATILLGTDTFLFNYGKQALPQDFASLRYIFGGAEKIQEKTQNLWITKFSKKIYEGYGATECAAVVSVNFPIYNKENSIGKLLPLIQYKIEKIDQIEEGGNLLVSGPNIMMGYYKYENPKKLIPLGQEWYKTGDIVSVDKLNIIKILGRLKRFAKISGEMVSLSSIEEHINAIWSDFRNIVVTKDDQKKGEVLVLVTNNQDADINAIKEYYQLNNLPNLILPKKVFYLENIPLLGSGKANFMQIKEFIKSQNL